MRKAFARLPDAVAQNLHDRRRQHVHAEKAQIMARPQTRHDQLLLRFRRGGFLQDFFDHVEMGPVGHAFASHGAVIRQQALPRRLHRRNGGVLRRRDVHQLLGATPLFAAQVKMIAHQVEKRFVSNELLRAIKRLAVAQGGDLLDKVELLGPGPRRRRYRPRGRQDRSPGKSPPRRCSPLLQ